MAVKLTKKKLKKKAKKKQRLLTKTETDVIQYLSQIQVPVHILTILINLMLKNKAEQTTSNKAVLKLKVK